MNKTFTVNVFSLKHLIVDVPNHASLLKTFRKERNELNTLVHGVMDRTV
jgi:hypothetical protein